MIFQERQFGLGIYSNIQSLAIKLFKIKNGMLNQIAYSFFEKYFKLKYFITKDSENNVIFCYKFTQYLIISINFPIL